MTQWDFKVGDISKICLNPILLRFFSFNVHFFFNLIYIALIQYLYRKIRVILAQVHLVMWWLYPPPCSYIHIPSCWWCCLFGIHTQGYTSTTHFFFICHLRTWYSTLGKPRWWSYFTWRRSFQVLGGRCGYFHYIQLSEGSFFRAYV